MRKSLLLLSCGLVLSAGVSSQTILFTETFDTMDGNSSVAAQGDQWDAWSCNDAGADVAYISTEYAASGSNSMRISNADGHDMVLQFGAFTTGIYNAEWKMYVPSGHGAYFNALHAWNCNGTGAEWAVDVFFSSTGDMNWTAGLETGTSTFAHDTWLVMNLHVDLDADMASITMGGTELVSWTWSTNLGNGMPGLNEFRAINFYGFQATGSQPGLYFVDDVQITLEETINVAENNAPEFKLFPNPANDQVFIQGDFSSNSTVRVLDLSGKVVLSEQVNGNGMFLNTSAFADGYYFVEITSNGQQLTRKLVVSH